MFYCRKFLMYWIEDIKKYFFEFLKYIFILFYFNKLLKQTYTKKSTYSNINPKNNFKN